MKHNCETCKYWDKSNTGVTVFNNLGRNQGRCDLTWSSQGEACEETTAFALDGDQYNAVLVTEAIHECNQWEEKGEK